MLLLETRAFLARLTVGQRVDGRNQTVAAGQMWDARNQERQHNFTFLHSFVVVLVQLAIMAARNQLQPLHALQAGIVPADDDSGLRQREAQESDLAPAATNQT